MFRCFWAFMAFYICITTILVSPGVLADVHNVINVGEEDAAIHNVMYLEDKKPPYQLSELLGEAVASQFQVHRDSVLNLGVTDKTIWIKSRFRIEAEENRSIERILEIKNRALDGILFYYGAVDGGAISEAELTYVPRTEFLRGSDLLVPLTLQTNREYIFYLRAKSTTSLQVPLKIWQLPVYREAKSLLNIFYGLTYGVLIAGIIYSILSFLQIRKVSFLYNMLFTLSILMLLLNVEGVLFQYLLADYYWSTGLLTYLIFLPLPLFGVLFVRSFLHTKVKCPLEDKVLLFTLPLIAITPVVLALGMRVVAAVLLIFVILLWVSASLSTGIRCVVRGMKEARFFLAGWAIFFTSITLRLFEGIGVLSPNIYSELGLYFGPALSAVTFSFAITDQMQLSIREKSALQRSTIAAMKRSNEIKDEFLGKISHELRTPMNGVLGALQILKSRPTEEEFDQNINVATLAARNMISTVNNLLNYTEAVSGKMKLNKEVFKHGQFLQKISQHYNKMCETKKLRFSLLDETGSDLVIKTDMEKLEQVFDQLIDNAVKFTSEGHIKFIVKSYEVENTNKIGLCYIIEDSGIGIDEQKMDQIFEYFSQADNSNTRRYSGLGMGISVARCISDLMGGEFSVKNNTDNGVCIQLRVEFEIATEEERLELTRIQGADAANDDSFGIQGLDGNNSLPVLIVEDNKVNQMVLNAILKRLGYKTLIAENGKVAVEVLNGNAVAAILMDIQMPVMDGYQATKLIRGSNSANAQVPIIAVTANAMSGDREMCMEIGMNDYLKKPVEAKLIEQKLERWLLKKAG